MHLASSLQPLYILSGFLVGLLVGQTGMGGGSLMTPILVLLFGVHPAAAVGTDLLYASITKSVGTAVHGANHTVQWGIVARLALGSVPATALTLFVLSHFDVSSPAASHVISLVLGVMLLLTAAALLFRAQILAWGGLRLGGPPPRHAAGLTVLTGVVLGVLVTISSVGAGAIGVTVLLLLYPDLPMARIVGSDIAHAVPLTLLAGIGHWFLGAVNLLMLGSLLCGSIPGIVLGSLFAVRVPDYVLRPILAVTLAVVGATLVA
ncbi:MAG TPA: sulfite exporter TauE/SafE family protein [Acetobacteraceae bacterium]|jgi:uncharacterized protein|nr:sulfite exporter TauE/SafE family protein [Acetobacteraceae bacterium]